MTDRIYLSSRLQVSSGSVPVLDIAVEVKAVPSAHPISATPPPLEIGGRSINEDGNLMPTWHPEKEEIELYFEFVSMKALDAPRTAQLTLEEWRYISFHVDPISHEGTLTWWQERDVRVQEGCP